MKKIKKVFYVILILYIFYLFTGGKLEHETEDEKLFEKYIKVTKNEHLTFLIIKYCKLYEVDIDLAVFLCRQESMFTRYAYNVNYDDTGEILSIDRGFFQLNSENKNFKHLTREQFYDPETNVKYGIELLAYCYNISGNYKDTVKIYNGGIKEKYKINTERHADRVINEINKFNKNLSEKGK
jgi:soluble lytic murein transglycosylase-like protein